jgi:CBS domain-containing protein
MTNSIPQQVADFLKKFEPFNFLNNDELISISNGIKIINLEKNQVLFQTNDKLHTSFYVVYSGLIHLSFISDGEENIIGKCHSGDIFGLRPFFAKNNYQMTAKSREDSLILAIPIAVFKPLMTANTEIMDFLLQSFVTNSRSNFLSENQSNLTEKVKSNENQQDMLYFQSLDYNKKPLIVELNSRIKEVSQLMTDNMQNSVIVVSNNLPIGIVTDTDFRSKVATGRYEIFAAIDKIMSTPVVTVTESISIEEAQLVMLKNDVTHLCVTTDGTENTTVKGVISEHDLVVAQANNPGVLLKQIKKAQGSKDLKLVRDKLSEIIQTSLFKNIPLPNVFSVSGEITLAIVKRAVELSILEMGSPPTRFGYFVVGSQGRKEQLLVSNQNSFLVFEDVTTEKYRDVKDYFLKLAKRTTSILEKVGFDLPENGLVANNLFNCKSLTEWKNNYFNWINTPGENTNDINSAFFDFDLAFGDQKIEDILSESIFDKINSKILFFDFLGNNALKKPIPLNFFKKFNLEEFGEHKGKFDIKSRAISPLVDAARLLALNFSIKNINNTYLRFKQLAIVDTKHAEIYLNCADAFLILSKFRTKEGLKNDSSGQYINLDELNKLDKEKLKSALAPMRELEELIKDKFQLTQFS